MNRKTFIKNTSLSLLSAPLFLNRGLISPTKHVVNGPPNCVLATFQTGGPFYLNPAFNRSDITEGILGHPMSIKLKVVDVTNCLPVPNAVVNLWHNNVLGAYSSFDINQGNIADEGDETWLRGYQITDCNGEVNFETIFPGWYPGRATHLHFEVRFGGLSSIISQLYFPETLVDTIYGTIAPYNTRTDGENGGPINPLDVTNDVLASNPTLLNNHSVCDIALNYDGNGNLLPLTGNYSIGIDVTDSQIDNSNCAYNVIADNNCLQLLYQPNPDIFTIYGDLSNYTIEVLDAAANVIQDLTGNNVGYLNIDLNAIGAGHYLRMEHVSNSNLSLLINLS